MRCCTRLNSIQAMIERHTSLCTAYRIHTVEPSSIPIPSGWHDPVQCGGMIASTTTGIVNQTASCKLRKPPSIESVFVFSCVFLGKECWTVSVAFLLSIFTSTLAPSDFSASIGVHGPTQFPIILSCFSRRSILSNNIRLWAVELWNLI